MLISIEVNDAGRMCLAIALSIKIYQIYNEWGLNENNIQTSENKTALYQYVIGDLVFSVVFIVCSLLVLIRYIFVSCLFLVSDYYS